MDVPGGRNGFGIGKSGNVLGGSWEEYEKFRWESDADRQQ